jgi:hypothetical protein
LNACKEEKMKKTIATITAVLLISGIVSVTSAHADRKTMEGFMLGTGVAILGAAIIHEINKGSDPAREKVVTVRHHRYDEPPYSHQNGYYKKERHHNKNRHHNRYARHNRGHWEVEKIWIEPVYEKKWNPGHYNRHGEWISGRYEKFVVQKGYWSEKKVWVWH